MIDSGVVHIIPNSDLINHETDIDSSCVCGPELEAVMRLDGSCGWVYLHHSLDAHETQ